MNLQELKKEMPFKWRVQSTNQYACTCVAYIDARDVQDLLDEVVGASRWQTRYSEHKGNLFCEIGILVTQRHNGDPVENWVWKSDCGTESQVEKQKGEASDAFKRAAVMWGVGRFLYSLGIIKIKEVAKDKNGKYYPTFNGQKIWDINTHCNNIHSGKSKPVKKIEERKEALTIEKFDKAKLFTNDQIKKVLNTFRMSSGQRKELEDLMV